MSATKNWIEDYNAAIDDAAMAIEEAVATVAKLNDLIYGDTQEPRMRIPRADVRLLADGVKGLRAEIDALTLAQEPLALPPLLPGEIRFDFGRGVAVIG